MVRGPVRMLKPFFRAPFAVDAAVDAEEVSACDAAEVTLDLDTFMLFAFDAMDIMDPLLIVDALLCMLCIMAEVSAGPVS